MANLQTPLKAVEYGERTYTEALMDSELSVIGNTDTAIDGNAIKKVYISATNSQNAPTKIRLSSIFNGTVEFVRFENTPQHIVLDSSETGKLIYFNNVLSSSHDIGFGSFSFHVRYYKALQCFVVSEGLSIDKYYQSLSVTENSTHAIIVPAQFEFSRITAFKQDASGFWVEYPKAATTWSITSYNSTSKELVLFFNEVADLRFYFKK